MLKAEGFSCSLGVLYGGLGISKLKFLIKKIEIKFPAIIFLNFRSSNPGSGSGIRIRNYKNAGSGSVSGSTLNQCGSETLLFTYDADPDPTFLFEADPDSYNFLFPIFRPSNPPN